LFARCYTLCSLPAPPSYAPHPHPLPFPTRRSSDLPAVGQFQRNGLARGGVGEVFFLHLAESHREELHIDVQDAVVGRKDIDRGRSEEHTSELQSRVELVCRLLLEKNT